MQNPSIILSIDVGIKYLSYCILKVCNGATTEIKQWDNICITNENTTKMSINELTEHLLDSLNSHFDSSFTATYVIIENQPMLKNGLMKTMSVVIYTYFNMLRMHHGNINDVRFVSATNKLKCRAIQEINESTNGNNTYQDRKRNSISLAKIHVERIAPDRLSWFNEQKKKDDLADSLNQAIAFLERTLKLHL